MRTSAAQALELLFLQNAQQLGLEGQRQVTDFVQKESSGISHFEAADFLCDGPRKSTLLVSKQFALQEIEGYGSTVELYEWAAAACAEIVNSACDQLFAGTGFSQDQHSGIRWCDSLYLGEHRFQSRAAAYDMVKLPLFFVLFTGPKPFERSHNSSE